MNPRKSWCLGALALLLVAGGCGGPLVQVSGRVTYKDQPVPSTYVKFLPDDGGRPSHAVTEDDGKFTLKYTRSDYGVTRGGHTVILSYYPSHDEQLGKIQSKASPELKAVIAKYGDPKTSGLHYEITHSGQFIEIKLDR